MSQPTPGTTNKIEEILDEVMSYMEAQTGDENVRNKVTHQIKQLIAEARIDELENLILGYETTRYKTNAPVIYTRLANGTRQKSKVKDRIKALKDLRG